MRHQTRQSLIQIMAWRLIGGTLQWRHNDHDGVSNHQPHDCLLNRLFICRSKKTSKLRVTGLCVGKSPMIGAFPAQRASNAEIVFIWWRHQEVTPVQAGLLSTGPQGRYFSEISNEFRWFSFRKMHLNISFAKWRPFCLGLGLYIQVMCVG